MKIKSSTMDKVFVTCNTIFLVLFVTITLYPVLNTVALSFNDGIDAVRGGIHLWPRIFTLSNYKTVLHQQNILTGAVVSVARTVLGTIFALVTNALLAYIISRKRFLFRSQLSLFWVITMYVNGGMIPTFLLVKSYGLLNTVWALVLPGAVPIFNVILVMNFFAAVPKELEEAAFIDGANPLQVLTKIFIPISKPVLATVSLFSIVGSWNDFYSGLIYMSKAAYYPLMTYIQSLQINVEDLIKQGNLSAVVDSASLGNTNLNAAKIVVAVIPLLLIYPLLQRYFVSGIVVGSVKG